MRYLLQFSLGLVLLSSIALAQDGPPSCLDGGKELPVDNQRVLGLMKSTRAQFQDRARVKGEVVQVLADKTGHDHFLIQIGPSEEDVLEVVYNSEFGELHGPREGQMVEACGDYITLQRAPRPASKQRRTFAQSRRGAMAIIHWVHRANPGTTHPSGYVVIDETVYGWELPEPKTRHR